MKEKQKGRAKKRKETTAKNTAICGSDYSETKLGGPPGGKRKFQYGRSCRRGGETWKQRKAQKERRVNLSWYRTTV